LNPSRKNIFKIKIKIIYKKKPLPPPPRSPTICGGLGAEFNVQSRGGVTDFLIIKIDGIFFMAYIIWQRTFLLLHNIGAFLRAIWKFKLNN